MTRRGTNFLPRGIFSSCRTVRIILWTIFAPGVLLLLTSCGTFNATTQEGEFQNPYTSATTLFAKGKPKSLAEYIRDRLLFKHPPWSNHDSEVTMLVEFSDFWRLNIASTGRKEDGFQIFVYFAPSEDKYLDRTSKKVRNVVVTVVSYEFKGHGFNRRLPVQTDRMSDNMLAAESIVREIAQMTEKASNIINFRGFGSP